MNESDWLAERFEGNRTRLRAVAYRILGSLTEADDAVQESRLRLSRSDAGEIENLDGWLTTVVTRVCLNLLRSRKSRREEPLDVHPVQNASRGVSTLLLIATSLVIAGWFAAGGRRSWAWFHGTAIPVVFMARRGRLCRRRQPRRTGLSRDAVDLGDGAGRTTVPTCGTAR
jgi:hypothetical protein